MKKLTKECWARVSEKAHEVVDAIMMDDDVMAGVRKTQLLDVLDELEDEFGPHAVLYDTRADFTDDPVEKLRLYQHALQLARESNDLVVEAEILESLRDFQAEA